jgi:RNA ligase (TIGR02306 family)
MRCLKVEEISTDSNLYDLEIDGGDNNYIAEGIVVHNTNCQIGHIPGLDHDELFFNGCMYVASKGLGGQGLVMKNNERNAGNTYVRILNQLLADGFGERIRDLSTEIKEPVRIFGEIFGAGLQKGFTYGRKEHTLAAFDIQFGWNFLPDDEFQEIVVRLGLPTVPVLYRGPFDREVLKMFRDGKNTLGHDHIREGIVIKARDGSRHPIHGRKIGKWVSPAYLIKSTGEEIN